MTLSPTLLSRSWPKPLGPASSWPLYLASGLIGLLALLPLLYLLIRVWGSSGDLWVLLARPRLWAVFGHSLLLALITTAASIAIGLPLAWLTTRTDLPFKSLWTVTSTLPLAMPSYVMAYAFIALLGPAGALARALEKFGLDRFPDLYGLPGTAIVLTLINYPFVVLNVRAALARLDPSVEEAARGLGVSSRAIFWRVILPHLRPALASGGLLVALYALSDFGAPALMQYKTFTRVIYVEYGSAFDRTSAALTALVLVAFTSALLAVETLARGSRKLYRVTPAAQRPPSISPLGSWKWLATAYCALMFMLSVGIPVLAMSFWIIRGRAHGSVGGVAWSHLFNSTLAGILAALAAAAAAIPVVWLAVRRPGRASTLLDRAAYSGYAMPGIVVALALVFFGARLNGIQTPGLRWLAALYQSLPMLILGYAIRFLPEAMGSFRMSLLQLNPRLEEAGRGLGRSAWAVFFAITLPMLAPGLLAGMGLVFLTTIKELPITLLLAPTGFETLVGEVWSNATEGLFAQASPPALVLVAMSALLIVLILRAERRGQYG